MHLIDVIFDRLTLTSLFVKLIELCTSLITNLLLDTVAVLSIPNKAGVAFIEAFAATFAEGITFLEFARAVTERLANILDARILVHNFASVFARVIDMHARTS